MKICFVMATLNALMVQMRLKKSVKNAHACLAFLLTSWNLLLFLVNTDIQINLSALFLVMEKMICVQTMRMKIAKRIQLL